MKIKMICIAAALSVAAVSHASAGGLFGGGSQNGIGNGLINISPKVGVLNGSNTNVLSGILSGNAILNGNNILSGNSGNSLLGLGLFSGNGSGNVSQKNVRR